MTPKRLKEIQDRCANASEGPWTRGSLESYHGGGRNSGIPFRRVYRKADSEAIDQIVALEPPPVGTGQGRHDLRWDDVVRARDEQGHIEVEGANCDDDAEFIAHARQDIPDLLAEIARLRQNAQVQSLNAIDPRSRFVKKPGSGVWVAIWDGAADLENWAIFEAKTEEEVRAQLQSYSDPPELSGTRIEDIQCNNQNEPNWVYEIEPPDLLGTDKKGDGGV